jgi:hypothetical protein
MPRRHAIRWLTIALWVWVAGGGCSTSAPGLSGSTEEATVTGIVRVRGKPATNGEITFRSSNANRRGAPTKNASIEKDGRYTITTLVGENVVMVVCKELFKRENQMLLDPEDGQTVKVAPGENTIDIDLPPRPPAPTR